MSNVAELAKYAQTVAGFATQADSLAIAADAFCPGQTRRDLVSDMDGVTDDVVMHVMLLRAQNRTISVVSIQHVLLAHFGEVEEES